MSVPRLFENAGQVPRADSCEPLKAAIARSSLRFSGWARGAYPGLPIPDGVLERVRSLGVWDAAVDQDWGLGEHCNEGMEITCLSRGSLDFADEARRYRLEDRQVTVTRPWQLHEVGGPMVTPSRLAWIILDVGVRRPNQIWDWPDWVLLSADERARLARIVLTTDRTVWNGAGLAPWFERMTGLLASAEPAGAETAMKVVLNGILVTLLDNLERGGDPDRAADAGARRTVRIFLARLKDHLDHDWTAARMAEQCGMSRAAFAAQVRAMVTATPRAHLAALRVEHARTLLRSRPDLSLTEIALGCGFGSSAYFSFVFHRMTGVAPSRWRREADAEAPSPRGRARAAL